MGVFCSAILSDELCVLLVGFNAFEFERGVGFDDAGIDYAYSNLALIEMGGDGDVVNVGCFTTDVQFVWLYLLLCKPAL